MDAGRLRAWSTELLHFISFHPVDLISIQESILNLSFSRSLYSLLCDLIATHSRSRILSPDTTHASGGVVIIFVRQSLFFELSIFFLSSLDLCSDHVGVNISLNNSFLLSLDVYAPFICYSSRDSRTDSFSLFTLSSSKNLFIVGNFNCYHSLWSSKGTSDLLGKEVFVSTPLTSFLSMTLTYLLFSIAPLAIAPPLTSPLLSPLSPSLAHGRCFRTWVLIAFQFN